MESMCMSVDRRALVFVRPKVSVGSEAGESGRGGRARVPREFVCHALALQSTLFSELTRPFTILQNSILPPGLNWIMWPIDSVVGRVSARVQQLVCDCGTKTKDNVFVSVQVIVQYQVIVSQAYDAYYKLTDPHLQIRSYVFLPICCCPFFLFLFPVPEAFVSILFPFVCFLLCPCRLHSPLFSFPSFLLRYVEDIVRSTVPRMELDSAFEAKEELAHAIRDSLQQTMGSYG